MHYLCVLFVEDGFRRWCRRIARWRVDVRKQVQLQNKCCSEQTVKVCNGRPTVILQLRRTLTALLCNRKGLLYGRLLSVVENRTRVKSDWPTEPISAKSHSPLGPQYAYRYFSDNTSSVVLFKFLKLNQNRLSLFRESRHFVCWGPFVDPITSEMERPYLLGNKLWRMNSWMPNKNKLRPTAQG
jgi:hypothetical protein